LIRCQLRFAFDHAALDIDGTVNSLHHAGKLGQQPITHQLDDAPSAFRDARLNKLSMQGLEARECSSLVRTHEPGEADNIGGKYGG
jgi:hypothetical protein